MNYASETKEHSSELSPFQYLSLTDRYVMYSRPTTLFWKTSILHILLQRNSYSILSLLWYYNIYIKCPSYTGIQCIDFHHKINLNSKHARLWVSKVHRAFIKIKQTTTPIIIFWAGLPCLHACIAVFSSARYTGYALAVVMLLL